MTMNAATLLDQAVLHSPERIFIKADETHLSYAQVESRARRFAAVLAGFGIGHGQSIALMLPNSPDFVACYFGALKLGVTVVPLNVASPAPELTHYLNDSGALLLVTSKGLLPVALQSTQQAAHCRQVLAAGDHDAGEYPQIVQWLDPLIAAAPETFVTTALEKDATALLLYTSGTTGKPKAARITHGNILAFTPIFARDILELEPDSVVLMVAPGSHAIGQVLLNTATRAGCTLSLLPRFEPQLFLKAVQRDQVTSFISVPSLVRILLSSTHVTPESLRSLRTIMIGGAALQADLGKRFIERFGVRLKVSYAMTEAYAITFGEVGHIPDNSVGKPAEGVALRLVDERNQDVLPGEPGEVLVRSPQVFSGYHNLPDQGAVYWVDDWFRTGDIGYLDPEGNLFLVGRRKEIIKSSGFTIYPAEVEEVLQSHPAVAAAVVAGAPYESMGEIVVAFVVAKPGELPAANELIRFCKDRLAGYKCPRRVEFRQAFPLNSAGKVLRSQLLEELR